MKKNKLHLTAINFIMLLMLYCTPIGAVHASLKDELQPIPVNNNWNTLVTFWNQMHSSPDGRFLTYVEYQGERVPFGSDAYFEEKPYTYRHVVFDRISNQFVFGPEISIYARLVAISWLNFSSPVLLNGDIYFTVPDFASVDSGIYHLNYQTGHYQKKIEEFKTIFSMSNNSRFALVSRMSSPEVHATGLVRSISIYDLVEDIEYPIVLDDYYVSNFRISDLGGVVLNSGGPYFANPVTEVYQSIPTSSVGYFPRISPDERYLVGESRGRDNLYLMVKNILTGEYNEYLLGSAPEVYSYYIDADNRLHYFYTLNGDGFFGDMHYGIFDLQQGEISHEEILPLTIGEMAYLPAGTASQVSPVFFMGISKIDPSSDDIVVQYFFRSASQRSLKIDSQVLSVDTYYAPQFGMNIDSLGEHYAIDVECTVTGPASFVSALYGDWGSDNRLPLPLQIQSNKVSGALSQRAPDVAVTDEQSLLETVILAEMVTGSMTVTCEGEMSDSYGNLLSVTPDTVTVILDNGIHGGETIISGQILLPGDVLATDVQVTLTIDGRTMSVNPNADGSFSFDGLRAGDFVVSYYSEGYVQACSNVLSNGQGNITLSQVELLAGDINRDGIIDIADFTFLAGRYGTRVGDSDYSPLADLNSDGAINIQDLAILASHFGSQQCQ